MNFTIIALLCILGQDPSECQEGTAIDVQIVGEADSDMRCFQEAQMDAAAAGFKARHNQYVKLLCRREHARRSRI